MCFDGSVRTAIKTGNPRSCNGAVSDQVGTNTAQISANLKKLSNLFVTLFLDAHQTPPARITLDIDATDVETHGRQENVFFHGYYEHRCFLPLYVFCGRHLLLA